MALHHLIKLNESWGCDEKTKMKIHKVISMKKKLTSIAAWNTPNHATHWQINILRNSIPSTVKQQEKRRSTSNRSDVLRSPVPQGGHSSKRHPFVKVLHSWALDLIQMIPFDRGWTTWSCRTARRRHNHSTFCPPTIMSIVPNLLKDYGSPRFADFWPADDKSRFRTAVRNARRWRMPKQHESPHHALHPLASPGSHSATFWTITGATMMGGPKASKQLHKQIIWKNCGSLMISWWYLDDYRTGEPQMLTASSDIQPWNRPTEQNKEQSTTKNNKRGISRNEAEGLIWQCSKCCSCQCLMM